MINTCAYDHRVTFKDVDVYGTKVNKNFYSEWSNMKIHKGTKQIESKTQILPYKQENNIKFPV